MATDAPHPATHGDRSGASTPELIASIATDARELAVGHLHRMQAEISAELRLLEQAMARIAIAVTAVGVGAILAGHALAQALVALGLPAWVAYAITAVAATIVGFLLLKVKTAPREDLDLFPAASLAEVRRDLARIRHAATDPAPAARAPARPPPAPAAGR